VHAEELLFGLDQLAEFLAQGLPHAPEGLPNLIDGYDPGPERNTVAESDLVRPALGATTDGRYERHQWMDPVATIEIERIN